MSLSVYKFGGSSLANVENIGQVISIIEKADEKLIVVLSAMGGVTDELYFLADRYSKGKADTENLSVKDIITRYVNAANGLISDDDLRSEYFKLLDETQTELEALYSSIEVTGELTVRVKARIVSFGETLMANLMDRALKSRKLQSEFVDSKSIIKLSDEVDNFEPIESLGVENSKKILLPLLKSKNIIVVQGFIGATLDEKVMTLGRRFLIIQPHYMLLISMLTELFYIKKLMDL